MYTHTTCHSYHLDDNDVIAATAAAATKYY